MIVQVPALTPRTVPLLMVQTGSVVVDSVTVASAWLDVAVTVPVPPTLIVGAAAKLIVCAAALIGKASIALAAL